MKVKLLVLAYFVFTRTWQIHTHTLQRNESQVTWQIHTHTLQRNGSQVGFLKLRHDSLQTLFLRKLHNCRCLVSIKVVGKTSLSLVGTVNHLGTWSTWCDATMHNIWQTVVLLEWRFHKWNAIATYSYEFCTVLWIWNKLFIDCYSKLAVTLLYNIHTCM